MLRRYALTGSTSTSEAWQQLMDHVSQHVVALRLVPAEEMLAMLDRCEAIGPVIEPTAYRDGGTRLDQQRRILRAVYDLQRVADDIAGPIGGPAA